MCYCSSTDDDEILSDILRADVPDDALVKNCCWRRICQVRGRNFNQIDDFTWREICRQRGYLYSRENPRGF
jgi:hypothetical protein